MKKYTVEVKRDAMYTWWVVRARNGRILLQSEMYNTKYPAIRVAKKFQKDLPNSTYKERV